MRHTEPDSDLSAPAPAAGITPDGLLGRVLKGDPEAWHGLVFLYVPLVLYWCKVQGLVDPQAEETACEVFHTVAARVGEYPSCRPRLAFRDWLRRLVHDSLETRHAATDPPETRPPGPPEPPVNPGGCGETDTERWLLIRRVLEMVGAEFERGSWDASRRLLLGGETVEAISASLGQPLAKILTTKARLLARLREELRDLDE